MGRIKTRMLFRLLAIGSLLLLSGCSSIGYYSQSIIGHSRLMLARQPLAKAIQQAEQSNNKELSAQLKLASQLKHYAISELDLPDNNSYNTYVALDRDFPVWSVVAAEEFSIEAKTWCYPVVGCAAYRGYFSKQAAEDYAKDLQKKDLETTISGAVAYSTLGWFNDPLLPSMMRYGTADFVETLFHELAHQRLYVKGDSAFNEAFATVVGEQGAMRWLTDNRPDLLVDYRRSLAARIDFGELLNSLKQRLQGVYASSQTANEKRTSKEQLLSNLKGEYDLLKSAQWGGFSGYDRWFEKPLNNARLAAFATYREQVPRLLQLFDSCEGDFEQFYEQVQKVKAAD